MKHVVVVATATRSSGALTIYSPFLSHLIDYSNNFQCVIFVHPSMPHPTIANVRYVDVNTERYFDRVMFDWYKCKQILKSIGVPVDVVISLQNTGVQCLKNNKTLIYYHQGIPFYNYKCDFFDAYERVLAMYKYIYPIFVRSSISSKTHFVAQIPFMAKNIIKRYRVKESNVHILPPDVESINIDNIQPFGEWDKEHTHFIYPATSYRYKRHSTIIKALGYLKHELNTKVIRVHFTINEKDSPEILELVNRLDVSDLVDFMGVVPHERLLSMYKRSDALLFPSVIETYGLPMLEASVFGIPLLVSDMEYAHDVVGNYSGAKFISPENYKLWAKEMDNVVKEKLRYECYRRDGESSWNRFFEIVENL